MGMFVTSLQSKRLHGVYGLERKPPPAIVAQGTGVVAIVAAFPWGPAQQLVEPGSLGEALNMFAPRGMAHGGSSYMALISKAFPELRIVRAISATAAAATCILSTAAPAAVCTIAAKYKGTEGNNLTAVVAAASDGDANHFNLTVSITGASGTTTETLQNVNLSGTGADTVFDFSTSLLIASITKTASGRPEDGTSSFSGGTSPALVSGDYVGTLGNPDKGLSLLEADKTIRHVCTDDPGNSLRAAVNAGVLAHVENCGDRIGYINGPSGQTASAARTDAALYQSFQVVYVDSWVYQRDDIDGTEHLVPPAVWAASVAAQTSPSTSIAWKDQEVGAMLAGITRLEADRGTGAANNSDAGIVTFVRGVNGGWRFEADPNTAMPVDASRGDLRRSRMAIYLVTAFVRSLGSMVDSPNVPENQDKIVLSWTGFLKGLLRARDNDANHNPHINAYSIAPTNVSNAPDDIQAGQFIVATDVQTSAAMSKIGLSLQIGTTVKVIVTS